MVLPMPFSMPQGGEEVVRGKKWLIWTFMAILVNFFRSIGFNFLNLKFMFETLFWLINLSPNFAFSTF